MPSAATTLQMLGLAGLLSYAVARAASRFGAVGYNRYALVAVPVSRMPDMPRGYRVAELDIQALKAYEIDVAADVQAARFAQDMTCLGAFNAGNDLVGVTWVGRGPFVEDEVHVRFVVPEDAGWDTGLWIKPEHRLGRGFAALWAGTAQWLKSRNCHWSMSRIADYNLPSLRSHHRMGAVTIDHITTFRFFRWQWMAQGQPRIIRLSHDARPAEMVLAPDMR